MSLDQAFTLAHDSEFRTLVAFSGPPRAGRVLALEPSGQVRVEMDDPDGGDVLAWPLNGATYAVEDIVYCLFAANSPDSAIVIGAKGSTPTYTPLRASEVRAADSGGLKLTDDAGNPGLFVQDGGWLGLLHTAPLAPFDLTVPDNLPGGILATYRGKRQGSNLNVEYFHTGDAAAANSINLELILHSALNGANQKRTAAALAADFTNTTDAARTSRVRLRGATNGSFGDLWSIGGKRFGLFDAAAAAQGPLHVHDSVAGLLFSSNPAVTHIVQTLIPNAAGDVVHRVIFFYVVENGGSTVADYASLTPTNQTHEVVVGSGTWRFRCALGGNLEVYRSAGAGTARVAVLALWL